MADFLKFTHRALRCMLTELHDQVAQFASAAGYYSGTTAPASATPGAAAADDPIVFTGYRTKQVADTVSISFASHFRIEVEIILPRVEKYEKKLAKKWRADHEQDRLKKLAVRISALVQSGQARDQRAMELQKLYDDFEVTLRAEMDEMNWEEQEIIPLLNKKLSVADRQALENDLRIALATTDLAISGPYLMKANTMPMRVAFLAVVKQKCGNSAFEALMRSLQKFVPPVDLQRCRRAAQLVETGKTPEVALQQAYDEKLPSNNSTNVMPAAAAAGGGGGGGSTSAGGNLEESIASLLKSYNRDELASALKKLAGEAIGSSPSVARDGIDLSSVDDEVKGRAIKLFNIADKDGSGTIDEYELLQLLKDLLGDVTNAEANRIYQEMDADHSGVITYDEFLVGYLRYQWEATELLKKDQQNTTKIPGSFEWEIPFKELSMGRFLGQGSYGSVHQAKWRGIDVAVKRLIKKKDKDEKELVRDFKAEVGILGKLRHPNVLLFMGVCLESDQMAIITEFLPGGSIGDVLNPEKNPNYVPNVVQIVNWSKQAALGLNYLHLSKIVHRDLKPDNLMLDAYKVVKLADFGLSAVKPVAGEIKSKEGVGTPMIWAPELLIASQRKDGFVYSTMSDIYALSLTIWSMFGVDFFDDPNFQDVMNLDDLRDHVVKHGARPTLPLLAPPELRDLLQLCWHSSPERRRNCAQIIADLERLQSRLNPHYY